MTYIDPGKQPLFHRRRLPEGYLTYTQAARLLGVSHQVISHHARKGNIRTIETATGRRGYLEEDVQRLLDRKTRRRTARQDAHSAKQLPEGYLTSRQGIAILGISRQALFELGKRGRIHTVRAPNGRTIGYLASDIRQLALERGLVYPEQEAGGEAEGEAVYADSYG